MENYSELIPIPYKMEMNNNLSSAKESTMLKVLGKPGALTTDCGEVNSEFAPRLKYGVNIGPFKASGLQQAVESLIQIFAQIKIDNVELYNQVRQDGMLCVRSRRNNASRYSNHSWGTAIDLYYGTGVLQQGIAQTQRGIYMLSKYFMNYGWYWGAEFSGDSVDSMHFELAEETIWKIYEQEHKVLK